MLIYIARHGKTNQNELHLVSGNSNMAQLIEEGRIQAEKLGKFLKNKKIDLIISSPLDRALETSKIINKEIKIKLETNDLLREFDFGDLDGKSENGEVKEFLEKRRQDINLKSPNGGSYADLLSNADQFIKIISRLKEKTILIVSHAGIIRCILANLLKEPIEINSEKLDTIDCPNGIVYSFDTKTKNLAWFNLNSDKTGENLLYRTSY